MLKKKDTLDKRLEDNIHNLIITSLILTAILLFISIYISKILEKRFSIYKDEIKSNLNEITRQHTILAQQSKMAAIGEMIANIAHQWRQPLSIISTSATGLKLKKEMNDLSDEEFISNLDYINNSTQYLSKTIDDFRNFFSNDKQEDNFSIKEALENSLNIVGVQYKNKNIHIIQNIDDTKILGIKSELIQVFINILNNSRDELIKNENNDRFIFIDVKKEDDNIVIQIKDNAGGINPEILKQVFKAYFTTKANDKGTGIGLYMSQEIIRKHLYGEIFMENIEYQYEGKNYKGAITTIKLKNTNL